MWTTIKGSLIFKTVLLVCICLVATVFADDTEAILKQVDKDLRSTERDMFAGKTEKAIASLENINLSLQKVKADDPDNPKLKTAENKYNKLVKDLERRTGKNLGAGTLTAAAASTPTTTAPVPEAKEITSTQSQSSSKEQNRQSSASNEKLPYDARKPMSNASAD
jgi:hypothetical protein